MKQQSMHAPWLKGYHWEDLANLHVELNFLRHRLIRGLNDRIAREGMESLERLDQFARVDEMLSNAGAALEKAKTLLFNLCYEHSTRLKPGKTKNS